MPHLRAKSAASALRLVTTPHLVDRLMIREVALSNASLAAPWRPLLRPATLRLLSAAFAGCAALALGGCGPTGGFGFGASDSSPAAPTTPVQSQPLSGPTVGETIGAGPARVGLILPLTQGSGPSPVGVSLRNAAALAMQEAGNADVTLMVLDDRSMPDGAAQAAQSAIGAGAEMIIGPLYAP